MSWYDDRFKLIKRLKLPGKGIYWECLGAGAVYVSGSSKAFHRGKFEPEYNGYVWTYFERCSSDAKPTKTSIELDPGGLQDGAKVYPLSDGTLILRKPEYASHNTYVIVKGRSLVPISALTRDHGWFGDDIEVRGSDVWMVLAKRTASAPDQPYLARWNKKGTVWAPLPEGALEFVRNSGTGGPFVVIRNGSVHDIYLAKDLLSDTGQREAR